MKKVGMLLIVLLVGAALMVTGCGGNDDAAQNQNQMQEQQQSEQQNESAQKAEDGANPAGAEEYGHSPAEYNPDFGCRTAENRLLTGRQELFQITFCKHILPNPMPFPPLRLHDGCKRPACRLSCQQTTPEILFPDRDCSIFVPADMLILSYIDSIMIGYK